MHINPSITLLVALAALGSTNRASNAAASFQTLSKSASTTVDQNTTTNDTRNQFPAPFPNVPANSSAEAAIESAALGTLPEGNPPPSKPSEDSLISLGLIAFNELFEVAFFTELIHNITSHTRGYTHIRNRETVLRVLRVVQAQEELHELNANGAFAAFTGHTIQPCTYAFPVDNFKDAIALASKFTDVVLATLPDIQTVFAMHNDSGLIRGVGSVIGQEGEQNGFYRHLLGQVPNQLPFLTAGARDFAFNAILQNFVVQGSCPNVEVLLGSGENGMMGGGVGLRTIDTLTLLTDEGGLSVEEDTIVEFSASTMNAGLGDEFLAQTPDASGSGMWVTYINQQNAPFSVKVQELTHEAGPLKFKAVFPGKSKVLNGLTIAAVTRSDFSGMGLGPDDVAAEALFGPALIDVNQKI